jgi:hypothetical protein
MKEAALEKQINCAINPSFAVGSRYYPRGVTAILWLLEDNEGIH